MRFFLLISLSMFLVACGVDQGLSVSQSQTAASTPAQAGSTDFTAVSDVHFPQLKTNPAESMQALLEGTLLLEDGCMRVGTEAQSYLVIWRPELRLMRDAQDELVILDQNDTVVGRIDQPISLGGGEISEIDQAQLQDPLPACRGPWWIASSAVNMP